MPKGNRGNRTGKGWAEQGGFEFKFSRKPHHNHNGRMSVPNGHTRSGDNLICCVTTGILYLDDEESVKETIRRDGYISVERY